MKLCCLCKQKKPLDEFNRSSRAKDGRQNHCRQCSKAHYAGNRPRHLRNVRIRKQVRLEISRHYVRDYLLAHPCVDCGETDIVVLEFDHVRGDKIKNVAELVHKDATLAKIKAEIAKCDVRCANCHRRKTYRERKYLAWASTQADEAPVA